MSVTFSSNADDMNRWFDRFGKRGLLEIVARSMDTQFETMKGYIIANRMTGPGRGAAGLLSRFVRANAVGSGILGRVTGSGGSSLNKGSGAVIAGDTVVGIVGTNLGYIKAHEIGFSGTEQVRAHTRRIASRSRFGAFASVKRGKTAQGVAFVRQHSRNVNIPARHMIQRGIEDYMPKYLQEMGSAIELAWQAGGAA